MDEKIGGDIMSVRDERQVDSLMVVLSFDNKTVNKDLDDVVEAMADEFGMVVPNKRKYLTDNKEVVAMEIEVSPEFIDFHTLLGIYRIVSKIAGFRDMFVSLEKLNINGNLKKSL